MKVAILAGGVGSRLSEETCVKPKPMVEIGGKPILWHIMKHYAHYGLKHFVIGLGYKAEYIKRYMVDYCMTNSDLTVDLKNGDVKIHDGSRSDWVVELIDTGKDTLTGGRIKRLIPYMGDERFLMSWGDGVSDIDLYKLLKFHVSHGKMVTLTAVRPVARFGHVEIIGDKIIEFSEKPQTREGWINGAYFVVEPEAAEYIEGDQTPWERAPLENLARDGELMAYKHDSFWQCMDTLRDKKLLNDLWESGNAPWKIWDRPDAKERMGIVERISEMKSETFKMEGVI